MKILINVEINKNNDGSLFIGWKWNQNTHLNNTALSILNTHFKNAWIDQFKSEISDEYKQGKTYKETIIYDSFLKKFKHIKTSIKLYHFQDCLNLFFTLKQDSIYYYNKDENLNLIEIKNQLKTQKETILYDDLFDGHDLTEIYEYLNINKIWLSISYKYKAIDYNSLLNMLIDWTGHIY